MEILWSKIFVAIEEVAPYSSSSRDQRGGRRRGGVSASGWCAPSDETFMSEPTRPQTRRTARDATARQRVPRTQIPCRAGRIIDDEGWAEGRSARKAQSHAGGKRPNGRPHAVRLSEMWVGEIRAVSGAAKLADDVAPRSKLLTHPPGFVARDERDFISAVNALTLGLVAENNGKRPSPWATPTPKRLCRACRPENRIIPQAELVYFGLWLMRLGKPGFIRRGPAPDDFVMFQMVAAILAASLYRPKVVKAHAGEDGDPETKAASKSNGAEDKDSLREPRQLTATVLRGYWAMLYGELASVGVIRRRRGSAMKLLEGYLGFLAAQKIRPPLGKRPRALHSPLLQAAYDALKGTEQAAPG